MVATNELLLSLLVCEKKQSTQRKMNEDHVKQFANRQDQITGFLASALAKLDALSKYQWSLPTDKGWPSTLQTNDQHQKLIQSIMQKVQTHWALHEHEKQRVMQAFHVQVHAKQQMQTEELRKKAEKHGFVSIEQYVVAEEMAKTTGLSLEDFLRSQRHAEKEFADLQQSQKKQYEQSKKAREVEAELLERNGKRTKLAEPEDKTMQYVHNRMKRWANTPIPARPGPSEKPLTFDLIISQIQRPLIQDVRAMTMKEYCNTKPQTRTCCIKYLQYLIVWFGVQSLLNPTEYDENASVTMQKTLLNVFEQVGGESSTFIRKEADRDAWRSILHDVRTLAKSTTC
jgi:hypothetical protein